VARHLNHRLAKIHRTYTVEEVARRWGVHRNTVRQWIKLGLPLIDSRRPFLVRGRDLAEFLLKRRQRDRRVCLPGEIYCVRCRSPRPPAGGIADYEPLTPVQGNLIGICPICECLIYRRVSLAKLHDATGDLDVRLKDALLHIVEKAVRSVNSDFRPDGDDDQVQPTE
jgi:excisionase family DNA binding protein